jgi:transcription antitermination factor NusG
MGDDMAWHVARCVGRESRASLYLNRAGIRNFRPVEHHYFIDKFTKVERYRERPRFGGYVFVELHNDAERDAACRAVGVAGLLGWWTDDGYRLAQIPAHYVTDLMDAGPQMVGKSKPFNKGQKVRIAFNAVSEILAEYKELDGHGKAVVTLEAFGGQRFVTVDIQRLQAAE